MFIEILMKFILSLVLLEAEKRQTTLFYIKSFEINILCQFDICLLCDLPWKTK